MGEGGCGRNSRAATEWLQGTVKAVGRAVTGGWKCGWEWRWGLGMPLGSIQGRSLVCVCGGGGGGYPPPFKPFAASHR